ncbi:ATP-binding SpoIIE family protein phosphatase [Sphaerisporangium fuscum]|uniref:ATP-binding SpoIIE family protein phosphatase n=1 Tax=Sphaerisporangium fuscum TaxID=2835868 RepID=UPI002029AEE9|nr:SpoIIE family protein phosphatase [Sphaerisporangium fuscum]
MSNELVSVTIREGRDIFAVRRLGRDVAEAVGLDDLDQIRVGTALSEVGREILSGSREARVSFTLDDAGGGLLIDISYTSGASLVGSAGVALAARLMDAGEHDNVNRRITLRKRVPGLRIPGAPRLGRIRGKLAEPAPNEALEELRQQNRELAAALEDSRTQREQLVRLNAELEETNQGVFALYNQLPEELEETNRGVVALYAELDEKSAQLREASEAKNRFWATVSHELRTPLNSIIGLVRLLLGPGGERLSEEQQVQVELVDNSAQTLLALVSELNTASPAAASVVCLLLIDPLTGDAEVVNAGHIPPVLVVDGEAQYHDWGNLLIGAAPETYRVDRLRIPEKGALLLFTDGLIEDRDVPLDQSLEVVRQIATSFDHDLEMFCDRLIDHFGAREDDVAVVALRRTGDDGA